MPRKTESVYWELVRFYRIDGGPVECEALGLYCSKERANMERAIYMDTGIHEVQDEETVSIKVRKMREEIEEVELLDMDEIEMLGAIYG